MEAEQAFCPICGSGQTFVFLRRPQVPVHQNLLLADPQAASKMRRGNLTMRFCPDCYFAFNADFEAELLEYGQDYDNTQIYSPAFHDHIEELVRQLVTVHQVRNCRVVEVGCGKGDFLKRLVSYPDSGIRGLGFDPSYVGPEKDLEGRIEFQRSFYDEKAADQPTDVVVCRHVIEHVSRPLTFLQSIRGALADSGQARVFFETPCLAWILRHRVIWDFFYEHCSLFTAASLKLGLTLAGIKVISVQHVFGGQYLWAEGIVGTENPTIVPGEDNLAALAHNLSSQERSWTKQWQRRLEEAGKCGPVAIWGAGAKGATFCHLTDPECQRLACLVDINPAKQGKYVAGTGHQIIAPAEIFRHGIKTVLVLNPNYFSEIAADLARQHAVTAVDFMKAG